MLEDLKLKVFQANQELVRLNLVVFTWGNASGICREKGLVVIKPSGVSYEEMQVEDMVVVDLHTGKVVEGSLRPSSDTPTHLALYRAFPHIEGVVHTHSTYATAWAQAAMDIPIIGTTHADHFCGDIPCTEPMTEDELRGEYELNTGLVIARQFQGLNPDHIPGVLVRNHGPFCWGTSPMDAAHNAKVLEQCAKMAFVSRMLNPDCSIDPELTKRHFLRKHGPDAYYGQK